MALPTTITGISTAVACCGPFISSGGSVYFFGRDSTTAGQLDAMKGTAPATSFSSIANTTSGLLTTIQWIAGYQVADVIHLIVCSETTITAVKYEYVTFNMATDAFVLAEAIASSLNTEDSTSTPRYACSIVVRSTGEVVVFFQGARLAVMGTSYTRVYYSRRTGTNTWSAAVEVDAGGATDWGPPEAILGASDRVHFIWNWWFGTGNGNQRTLSSANVLQTASTPSGTGAALQGVSYSNSGTKVVCGSPGSTNGPIIYCFTSADTPTVTANTAALTAASGIFIGYNFNDGTTCYVVAMRTTAAVLEISSSTDDGATWGAFATMFTAGANFTSVSQLSIDGNIFLRGSSYVIPYVVNDNGTLKYNEYVVRVASTTYPQSCTRSTSPAAKLVRSTGKPLVRSTTPTKRFIRSTSKSFRATTTPTKILSRATAKLLRIAASRTASLAKSYTRPVAISKSATVTARRSLSTNKILRATTTPTKSILRAISKTLRASTTPSKRFLRLTSKALRGSSAPVARLVKSTAKTLRGAVTVATTLARATSRSVLARVSATASATLRRSTGKPLRRSTAPAARITKSTSKSLRAQTAAAARLVRSLARALRVSTAPVAKRISSIAKTLRAASSTPARLVRSTAKPLRASSSPAAALRRATAKTLRRSAGVTASLLKQISKILRAATSAVAALAAVKQSGGVFCETSTAPAAHITKQTGKPLSASSAPAAALRRSVSKLLTAATAGAGRLFRTLARTARAASAPAATLRRAISRALLASSSPAAALRRSAAKILRANTGPAASLSRSLARQLRRATAPVASLVAQAGNRIFANAATAPVARLVRSAAKSFAKASSPAARLRRSTSKAFGAAIAATARLRRATSRTARVSTAPVAALSRLPQKVLAVSAAAAASLRKVIAKTLRRSTAPRAAISRTVEKTILISAAAVATIATARTHFMSLAADAVVDATILISRAKNLAVSTFPRATLEYASSFSSKIAKIVLSIFLKAVGLDTATRPIGLEISEAVNADLDISTARVDLAAGTAMIQLTLTINGVLSMAAQSSAVLGQSIRFDASFFDFDGAPIDPSGPTLRVTQNKAVSEFTMEKESGTDVFSYIVDTAGFKPGPLYFSIHAESGGTKSVKEGIITLLANRATLNG
jgi:hypothetical protein